jgi:glutaminase
LRTAVDEAYAKFKGATKGKNAATSLISPAGEKLPLIEEVYKSEAATNQGNRALAALLLKYERIYADPVESVDV